MTRPRTPAAVAATDDAEAFAQYAAIYRQTFLHGPDRPVDPWFDRAGRENFRFIRVAGRVAAGLANYPCGQYFGGRRVACGAIAAVAVAPEHRATGLGSRLMRDVVLELAESGVPLAALYPATRPVYARAGFAPAGLHCRFQVPAAALDPRDASVPVRPATLADLAAMRALYEGAARRNSGWLDRPHVLWMRLVDPPSGKSFAYLFGPDDDPEGYVIFAQISDGGDTRLVVWDWTALTPAAATRLLAFLAAHRSMFDTVNLADGPPMPLLSILADPDIAVSRYKQWMLRLNDVPGALEARGYADGVAGELHLDIADDLVAANRGRLVLTVDGGRGQVRPGGRGDLRIDVRGLASLYTGFMSPAEVVRARQAEGPDSALAAAGAIFSGPAPWMPDMF